MPQDQAPAPSDHALLVSGLNPRTVKRLTLEPDASTRDAIAAELGFDAVRKLRFQAEVAADGKRDWVLTGTLGATIVQPCSVTLEPVTTRIDQPIVRRYLAHWDNEADAGSETEMPEDDSTEPLGLHIDPQAVMIEALALAAPDFPRSEAAEAFQSVAVTEPGQQVMTDDDVKPFAGLAALKAQMKDPEG